MPMNIRKLRNKISGSLNNLLYNSREIASQGIKYITILSSLSALGLLIYVYGFEPDREILLRLFYWIDIIFVLFLGLFLARLLYAFKKWEFIKTHKFEASLMLIILVHRLINYGFEIHIIELLIYESASAGRISPYHVLISIYMFLILAFEFVKLNEVISRIRIRPAVTFIVSFLIVILFGTGLLMLPAMTIGVDSMPFLDALFTSVSATCVTGLIVVDTATYFTFKGQLVIMFLIQIGGLGIVSFASFFSTFLSGGVGIKHQAMLQDVMATETLFQTRGLLSKIVLITFSIEFCAFIFIYLTWGDEVVFASVGDKIFFSAFHAISAFCNAGFSLYTNGLYENFVRDSYILHSIIIGTVILGGIGFGTLTDIFSPRNLRKRLQYPWIDWQIGTKIAVYVSAVLLVAGMLMFYLLEKNNTLAGMNFIEAMITSFFQSGSTRTAGFNTVDISQLAIPTLIIFIFLMFIGGSSNSIAGGIKTSTFYLIIASVIATIRGWSKIEISNRYISNNLVFRALSILTFAVFFNSLAIFILSITEPDIAIIDLAFEQISAFGTVGLSTGITASLSDASRFMIILSMFLGRVGTLTVAFAVSTRTSAYIYKYPKGHMMVG